LDWLEDFRFSLHRPGIIIADVAMLIAANSIISEDGVQANILLPASAAPRRSDDVGASGGFAKHEYVAGLGAAASIKILCLVAAQSQCQIHSDTLLIKQRRGR
jgi:hypothetical protein